MKLHEVRMRIHPRYRLSLCFKKSVDYDSLELVRSPSTQTGRFATNDRRPGVDRCARLIRENNFAAVGNPLGIDRAMSGA
ncbi:MAG: hypothetical protein DME48_09335 [Verrucomicrobia bacterium]|nr:MAG: hypothetical protein DME48_09335 [Verrucomicrobiota bacterium]